MEEFKNLLHNIYEDDIYEMFDTLSTDDVSDGICYLIEQLQRGQRAIEFSVSDYTFKVRNFYGGSVSCSDSSCTGVSNTLYYPVPMDSEHDWYDRLKNLIEMMNEAFYHCVN